MTVMKNPATIKGIIIEIPMVLKNEEGTFDFSISSDTMETVRTETRIVTSTEVNNMAK